MSLAKCVGDFFEDELLVVPGDGPGDVLLVLLGGHSGQHDSFCGEAPPLVGVANVDGPAHAA